MSESFVWKYFVKQVELESATCKECKTQIKCRGWSTSGLIRHLQNKHKIDKPVASNAKRIIEENAATSNKRQSQQTLSSFFTKQKETCEEIIAKLVTLDGISINSITKSEFIRNSLRDKGYTLPKNPSHVMDLVHKQYNKIKELLCSDIVSQLHSGSRFSLSLDEYTSLNNRRYLNINLHKNNGTFWNLGMVRISGPLPAETAIEKVKDRLEEFAVSLEKHVVACVTDGAAVMVKFGRLIECDHQLCYAHGIHLAVCDVLYKKSATPIVATFSEELHPEDENVDFAGEDEEDLNTVVDLDTECFDNNPVEIDIPLNSHEHANKINVSSIIDKIRKIARFFRKSPSKNNVLQGYVQQEHGKNLQLMLDSRTRWNSLLAMLERYIKIRASVSKALIDCDQDRNHYDLEKQEIAIIRDIIASLEPIKVGAEKLGNRKLTLLSSEGVFAFIINELNQLNTPFSKKLGESFILRIKERRNEKLSALIQYLNSGKICKKQAGDVSWTTFPTKSLLISFAKQMLDRLFDVPAESTSSETDEDIEETLHLSSSITLSEKLDAAVKAAEIANSKILNSKSKTALRTFKMELDIFEGTGEKTKNISLLLDALKTVPPTSIESERAFSAAGLFINKLRTRLSDQSIDHLCFLKSYYKNSM